MQALDRSYTDGHVVRGDGSVAFTCSQDVDDWPWLALPAQHPLVIQTQTFWTTVGAMRAVGTHDDSKWTALVWTDWDLVNRHAGKAVRGTFERAGKQDELGFVTELFDGQDRIIARTRGKGVVFRTRNFEQWREGSKSSAKEQRMPPEVFEYAPHEMLGLSEKEPALIAPLRESDGQLSTSALLTKENGLMPGHPYFSGSGDHVNAPHLAELGRQTVSLLREGANVEIVHGEMDMHLYIELGSPISLAINRTRDDEVVLAVSQLDRSCATITMRWIEA